MTVAVVVCLRSSTTERLDFASRDCDGIDEAMGALREALTLHGDEAIMAFVYPGRTVAEVRALPEAPPVPFVDLQPPETS